jgi:hypothetical protein
MHRNPDDRRPELDIAGDESGTLAVPFQPDDRYFVVATVGLARPSNLRHAMHRLRKPVIDLGISANRFFHACEDTRMTRRQLLTLLAQYPLKIDTTILDKQDLPPGMDPFEIYSLAWYEHLVHALPGLLLLPCSKARLYVARLSNQARKRGFNAAYNEATLVAYVPYMTWYSRDMIPPAQGIRGSLYQGPALLYGEGEPRDDRLLQVSDIVAWAVRRKWSLGDSSFYDLLQGHVRSERLLFISRCKHPNDSPLYRLGILGYTHGLRSTVHHFHTVPQYEVGPDDDFQRLLAVEQCINLNFIPAAASFARTITGDDPLVAAGMLAWPGLRDELLKSGAQSD